MKNIELKRKIHTDGTLKKYLGKRKDGIRRGELDLMTKYLEQEERTVLDADYFGIPQQDLDECERERHRRAVQTSRLRKHLNFLFGSLSGTAMFITWTIDDEHINQKRDTLKKAVMTTLSRTCVDHVTNIDFGELTERLHWHSVALAREGALHFYAQLDARGKPHLKCEEFDKLYTKGHYSIELIDIKKDTDKDEERLAKYISKLTTHSVKVAQTYVTCPKGSPYQRAQELEREWDERVKQGMPFWKDYLDEITSLMLSQGDSQGD